MNVWVNYSANNLANNLLVECHGSFILLELDQDRRKVLKYEGAKRNPRLFEGEFLLILLLPNEVGADALHPASSIPTALWIANICLHSLRLRQPSWEKCFSILFVESCRHLLSSFFISFELILESVLCNEGICLH